MPCKKMEAKTPRGLPKPQAPRGAPADGTLFATRTPDIISLVSAPILPRKPRPPAARPHMTINEVMRLVEAIRYGASRWPYWRSITINLTLLDAPQTNEQTMRRLLDHLRHWQERKDCPAYWLWVREQGGQLGDHVHILVAAPPEATGNLSSSLRRWLRGPSIRGEVLPKMLHTRQTSPGGWLTYVVKTVTPVDAKALYQQIGIRIVPEEPGGPVVGQRIGIARAIGPKARQLNCNTDVVRT